MKTKFIIGGLFILAAVLFLIISSTLANSQYFMTVEELAANQVANVNKSIRISGAVIGNTIDYDSKTLTLKFVVAHVPGSNKEIDAQGGLAAALHAAVTDADRPRLQVVYNGPIPDLLKDEAQAIMTGKLGQDGVFYADELLLKCPSKYEEDVPEQVQESAK
jgi:cytochrome c-type biogenesis protein CcmE